MLPDLLLMAYEIDTNHDLLQILATVAYVRDETPDEAQHAKQTKGQSSRLEEQKNELPNLCRFVGDGFPHLRGK